MAPSYWDYLSLDQLLSLQSGLETDEQKLDADELLFVVGHQTLELWFKLVLREVRLARDHLGASHVPEEQVPVVVHHIGRVNAVLRLAIQQFTVMETLAPQDFLAFRDKLTPASGFQSFQMRELEILLGLTVEDRLAAGLGNPLEVFEKNKDAPGGAFALSRIQTALAEQTLRDALYTWLERTPIQGSSPSDDGDNEAVRAFVDAYLAASKRHAQEQADTFVATKTMDVAASEAHLEAATQKAREFLLAEDVKGDDTERQQRLRAALLFIESYRDLPLLSWPRILIDAVVELEEQMVLFRSRHARMVERIIGRRVGTGGSSGVDYLDRTTSYRVFKELWGVRTLLLPRRLLPDLEAPEVYGFAR